MSLLDSTNRQHSYSQHVCQTQIFFTTNSKLTINNVTGNTIQNVSQQKNRLNRKPSQLKYRLNRKPVSTENTKLIKSSNTVYICASTRNVLSLLTTLPSSPSTGFTRSIIEWFHNVDIIISGTNIHTQLIYITIISGTHIQGQPKHITIISSTNIHGQAKHITIISGTNIQGQPKHNYFRVKYIWIACLHQNYLQEKHTRTEWICNKYFIVKYIKIGLLHQNYFILTQFTLYCGF